MTQPYRLVSGGRLDRARTLLFRFDGRTFEGHPGDTLASALLANGQRLVGRSFKYHRPRGFLTAGADEPSALVELRTGARREPNTRATMAELYDGLEARSQNRWPSLNFDVSAANGLLSRFLAAGFYYKTFMWPASFWERVYEPLIRRMAGLGYATHDPDPDEYEHRHAHCDVLVVGAGAAGLAAARAAGEAGARVILAEQDFELGGGLLLDRTREDWRQAMSEALAGMDEVRVLPRTTVFGFYEHNVLGAAERVADHLSVPSAHGVRQRYWAIRARQVVLATGSSERLIAFPNNDRPGVMLASAAETFATRFAVSPGRRAVLFTNNDEAYQSAEALRAAGVALGAVVDVRAVSAPAERLRASGVAVFCASEIAMVNGTKSIEGVDVRPRSGGSTNAITCDLVLMSGGFNPVVHLASQTRAPLVWTPDMAAFLPGPPLAAERSAGAARGTVGIVAAAADGLEAGRAAAVAAGFTAAVAFPLPAGSDVVTSRKVEPFWEVKAPPGRVKSFVDFQHDVTADDIRLAHREGYVDVQHAKRYTTHGMATDQGKTGGLVGVAILAAARGEPVEKVGLPTFRPYVTPVTWGALAGREVGRHFSPTRLSPLNDWHVRHGGVMQEAGLWKRAFYYTASSETGWAPIQREARLVRRAVGLCDVSTLGKIDVLGADAGKLLDRLYINTMSTLPVGKVRYGVMLREDGHVFDDGTCTRVASGHYFMTTTTAKAAEVMEHIEHALQVLWPDLDAQATSVTDQWCQMSLAGPKARDTLARCVTGADVSDRGLPYMGFATGEIAGAPVRLYRVSFSGELAYEVATPAGYGETVWETVLAAGGIDGIGLYGLEALNLLRIEKGHVTGAELNGQTTARDLGFGRMIKRTGDFIGRVNAERPGMVDPDRPALVGIRAVDADFERGRLRGGAHILAEPDGSTSLGWVTSVTPSVELGRWIGLAMVHRGVDRIGQRLYATYPLKGEAVEVDIVSPHHVDPENQRVRA